MRGRLRAFFVSIAVAAMAIGAPSCSCEGEETAPFANSGGADEQDCTPGDAELSGRVVAPDFVTPVNGADVTVIGESLQTVSDGQGDFHFDKVPGGDQRIRAEKNGFAGEATVKICVSRGNYVEVPIRPIDFHMAVVVTKENFQTGDFDYDAIQDLLARMGYREGQDFDIIRPRDLRDEALLKQYDYVFINCTNNPIVGDPEIIEALRGYVKAGGGLYVSDWAFTYIVDAWPDAIAFPDFAHIGYSTYAEGVVESDALAAYLGAGVMEIEFNLGAWVSIADTGDETQVLVRGDYEVFGFEDIATVTDGPLLVQFPFGAGRVTYTSFHHEDGQTRDVTRALSFIVFNPLI
ncbi:carboxypeptidase-like regulatory domain-containing protein [bacterium]|nr:carboxypeptidase-like regulatory domain-containing protein [bacterium]